MAAAQLPLIAEESPRFAESEQPTVAVPKSVDKGQLVRQKEIQ